MSRFLLYAFLLLTIAAAAFFSVVPRWVGASKNAAPISAAVSPSAPAQDLHRRLVIADLHADTLLWSRDLTERSSWGHIDLPRMLEGGLALQVFSAVTKVPIGANYESNTDRSDSVAALAIAQLWPIRTWTDLTARALYQAERLQRAIAKSHGLLTLIRSQQDLANWAQTRRAGKAQIAALLSIEGAQALNGDLANLDVLAKAGFRIVAPSHFFDTEIGGSQSGTAKGGLTALGRRWVVHMDQLELIIDLAHASAATIDDVLALSRRPVVVSHTGVKGTCDSPRNLSDEQLKRIAERGGLIGIAFFSQAVCGDQIADVVRAIRHAIGVAGVDHVALGSDFDGAVRTALDAARLPELTTALLGAGLSAADIEKVMGANLFGFLSRNLPR